MSRKPVTKIPKLIQASIVFFPITSVSYFIAPIKNAGKAKLATIDANNKKLTICHSPNLKLSVSFYIGIRNPSIKNNWSSAFILLFRFLVKTDSSFHPAHKLQCLAEILLNTPSRTFQYSTENPDSGFH